MEVYKMKKGIRKYCRASWAEMARTEFGYYTTFKNGINKLKDELIFNPEWYLPIVRYKLAKKIRRYYLTNKK